MGNSYLNCTGRTLLVLSFAFAIAWFLSPSSALAASTDLNGLTVTLPEPSAGWKKSGKGELYTLQKDFPETKDDKRGSALIQLSKPIAAPRNSLQDGLKTFVATLPDMAKEDVLVKYYGVTVNGYDIRVEERCCAYLKAVSVSQIVVGIASDKRQAYPQLVKLLNRICRRPFCVA